LAAVRGGTFLNTALKKSISKACLYDLVRAVVSKGAPLDRRIVYWLSTPSTVAVNINPIGSSAWQ